jgi:hypothetical protein
MENKNLAEKLKKAQKAKEFKLKRMRKQNSKMNSSINSNNNSNINDSLSNLNINSLQNSNNSSLHKLDNTYTITSGYRSLFSDSLNTINYDDNIQEKFDEIQILKERFRTLISKVNECRDEILNLKISLNELKNSDEMDLVDEYEQYKIILEYEKNKNKLLKERNEKLLKHNQIMKENYKKYKGEEWDNKNIFNFL